MSRAQQLSFSLSMVDAVSLQENHAQAVAYAQQAHEQLAALDEENRQLQAAVKAVKANLATARIEVVTLMRELARLREQAPRPPLDPDALLQLLKLCHPDRWQNQPATTLAHELTVTINKLRERGQV